MSEHGVIVITGIMASGKSTVAEAVARRLPAAAHVRGDTFRRMVVSGRRDPVPGDAEGAAQLDLRYRITAGVADGYAAAGIVPVVQDIVIGPALSDYVERLRTRPRHLVVLAPRADVVARREAERGKVGYGPWSVEDLDTALRETTPKIGLWLDTSEQSPGETAEEILTRLPEARVE